LRSAKAVDDAATSAQVHLFLSFYSIGNGDWDTAMEYLELAENLSRTIGDVARTEDCLIIASQVYFHIGDIATAGHKAAAALASARHSGNRQALGWAFGATARVQLAQGIPGSALDSVSQAMPLTANLLSQIAIYGVTAIASIRRGDMEGALRAARTGLKLVREKRQLSCHILTGVNSIAETYVSLWALAQQGAFETDVRALKRDARRAVRELQRFARIFSIGRANAMLHTGNYELLTGRPRAALTAWREGVEIAARMKMPYVETCCLLAIAHHATGAEGASAAERASTILKQLKVPAPPAMPAISRRE
jgi:eukaryotic-like serine/threonine-protein kinase